MAWRFSLVLAVVVAVLAGHGLPPTAAQSAPPAAPYVAKSPAPVLTEAGYPADIFFDDFTSPTLDPGWFFIRQDARFWRTGPPDDVLQIVPQEGDIYGAGATARNLILREAPANWEARTRLSFAPQLPTQQAGLILYQSDDTYLKLVRITLPPQFPGQSSQRVVMLYQVNGETKAVDGKDVPNTTLFLRLRRVADRVDGWWSSDGMSWRPVATMLDVVIARNAVGFFAVNGNDNPGLGPPATFDWFRLYNVTSLGYDSFGVGAPSVIRESTGYTMWFTGLGDNPPQSLQTIGYATSPDGIEWTKPFTLPVLAGEPLPNRDHGVSDPTVLKEGPLYQLWYSGYQLVSGRRQGDIYYATSLDGVNWTRRNQTRDGVVLPVLSAGAPESWDDLEVRPGRVVRDGSTLVMYYVGFSQRGRVGIGRATSPDGLTWTKQPGPVIPNASGVRGLVKVGSSYQIWYTRAGRVLWASSSDGITWSPGVVVLEPGPPTAWDSERVGDPWVILDGGVVKLWYSGGSLSRIGFAQGTGGTLTRLFLGLASLNQALTEGGAALTIR
ncbi:MAG: hypothetical protein KatS3mg061_2207 [Dehalococcoidia bacterium]|nr:MAG: hypothetical protein KatS3mg061_2207 [Dehalococcoidia bacterium]